jgi:hypothetical protein
MQNINVGQQTKTVQNRTTNYLFTTFTKYNRKLKEGTDFKVVILNPGSPKKNGKLRQDVRLIFCVSTNHFSRPV